MAYQKAPMLTVYSLAGVPKTDDSGNYITYYAQMDFCGFVELYSSLLWDIEYFTVGSFEVYLPAMPEYLELFQVDRVVGREDDTENYGVIESVLVEHDAENGDYMTVSGRFLPCLLERRVILPTAYSQYCTNISYNPAMNTSSYSYSNMLKYILFGCRAHDWFASVSRPVYGAIVCGYIDTDGTFTEWIVEATAAHAGRRMIPGLAINRTATSRWNTRVNTESGSMQVTGKNLMDWIYTIAETVGGTIKIDASNLVNNLGTESYMTLSLTEGSDLSGTVIFSDDFNNLSAMSYSINYTEYSNFAYALGEGEGYQRYWETTCDAADSPIGFERREIYVDSSSESSVDSSTTLSTEDIYSNLRESGLEALTSPTYAAEATIAPDVQYTYGEDYNVGDIVTIKYNTLGISLDARLTGMIESFDHTGRTLTPTFSFDV